MTARRLVAWTGAAAGALFAVLLVTGLVLVFQYEPSGRFFGSDAEPIAGAVGRVDTIRTIHRAASFAIVPVVVAAVVAAVVASRRRVLAAVLAILAVLATVGTAVSGQAIAWSQLALWAVTVGRNHRGYGPVFGSQVRYVLVGSREIAVDDFRRLVLGHVLGLPVLLLGLAVGVALVVRRRRPADNLPSRT